MQLLAWPCQGRRAEQGQMNISRGELIPGLRNERRVLQSSIRTLMKWEEREEAKRWREGRGQDQDSAGRWRISLDINGREGQEEELGRWWGWRWLRDGMLSGVSPDRFISLHFLRSAGVAAIRSLAQPHNCSSPSLQHLA